MPATSGELRSAPSQVDATDDAMVNMAYWNDELEEVAAVLAEEPTREPNDFDAELVAAGKVEALGVAEPDLPVWLDF